MQRMKECMICRQQLATTECQACGKLVCEFHIDRATKLCVDCKTKTV